MDFHGCSAAPRTGEQREKCYRSVSVDARMLAMSEVTSRLAERVRRDFPSLGTDDLVRRLADGAQGERLQAAVVLWAEGDLSRFEDSLALCEVDWRDVLVRSGLADDDWPHRLDAELGDGA
jgi:hypothetical protein